MLPSRIRQKQHNILISHANIHGTIGIAFGTAGLRSRMQAGFSRLNSLTIIQASQGLAAYLLASLPTTAPSSGVIIGHDHRHNSRQFAQLTAIAFILKGIKVYLLEDLVHTPIVPFGVGFFGCVAGVMITASHNPAQDNGYKVYWGNGCQIIPPVDAGIAGAIEENLIPEEGAWDLGVLERQGAVEKVKEQVEKAYFEKVRGVVKNMEVAKGSGPGFVYTPMHGVGLPAARRAVDILGLAEKMVVVGEQAQ